MSDPKHSLFSNERRWICIYPIYINSKKTLVEGRRIPKEKAVENPTVQEIADIIADVGLNSIQEKHKMHPRDGRRDPCALGRVKIQLKNDDDSLSNKDFPSRRSLMLYIAEMIPKLKSRQLGYNSNAMQSTTIAGGEKQKKKKK